MNDTRHAIRFHLCLALLCLTFHAASTPGASYTRLEPLPAPRITSSAEAYPGSSFLPANLIDGNERTEYSSNGKGTDTFVVFDFGVPTRIAAFRHVDRNDPAIIAASQLLFLDDAGNRTASVPVTHAKKRAGVTTLILPGPVTARSVRWSVSKLGAEHGTVGGAELAFYQAGNTEASPRNITIEAGALDLLEKKETGLWQPVKVKVHYPYAEPAEVVLRLPGAEPKTVVLSFGSQTVELSIPEVVAETNLNLGLELAGQPLLSHPVTVKPVRKLEIFVLPHSHVDIGYTALQPEVEKKQNENLETGLRLVRASSGYPEGSRFKWNMEVLWPVDNYLRTTTPEKRAAFLAAVKAGQVGLDALYCNVLTGLCRPEELLQLMRYATSLSELCGSPIESAMISDVPGYTWSTVSAMAHAGVRYFSFAPNYFDRMGGTMRDWQNRPFWWKGPDGRQRVLCWCPSRGYALGHLIGDGEALARFLPDYVVELRTNGYPYDISHLRWNVHGDNGSPDEKVAGVIRDWNLRYAYPRLTISTTAEAFRAFERRYGSQLPEYSGDYTPYWEDGAASSAYETALNRASAERIVQAQALWALRSPAAFPAAGFQEAWRNVLLYSEHTWGAHNSISEPDIPFVREQWRIKQAFALEADKLTRQLLDQAMSPSRGADGRGGVVDVLNTSSWERTDLVTVSRELSAPGDRVLDDRGRVVPSQRLSTGELVFLARDVPAFSARRFHIELGACPPAGSARADGLTLAHPQFTVRIDSQTGAISSLHSRELNRELVDSAAATALNDFFHLPGSDLRNARRNGQPRITVKEPGPLVASLLVESEAPGCKRLAREIRVIDGLDRIELINLVDKLPVRAKEGLHFGFGFNVPGGTVRMDVGWAVVRPELDQIPASCKNWFSVQRWLDISNDKFGVTWAPIDAPLVEIGGLTANLIGSQTNPDVWIQHLQPSQTIYSWVMNNHWHTNYRAEQEGPTVFRYAIRPHKRFEADAAARFGAGCSQPLLVTRASSSPPAKPRLKLSTDDVLVTALKPSDDGKATIARLFGASGITRKVKLSWSEPAPAKVWLSDTSERPGATVPGAIEVPAWGIVTLRAE
jgi:hypothetical protein